MSSVNIPHFGLKRQYKTIGEELLEASHNALSNGVLVDGEYTKKFETWLAIRTGAKYCLTVNSGTQALYFIAKHYAKIFNETVHKPLCVVPNFTYPATLNAILDTGVSVELIDTDEYGVIDLSNYNYRTHNFYKIPIIVGLYGRKPSNDIKGMNAIVDGAQHWLVAGEDIGLGMAISFDPTKNLPSSGIGGAVVTNSLELYNFVVSIKNNGKVGSFNNTGTNSKMSEQDCAQTLVRAKYLDEWQHRRKEINDYYLDRFNDLPIKCLSRDAKAHAYQKFVIYTSERNSLHTCLLTDGIDSKIHYEYALSDLGISKNLIKPDFLSKSVMLSRGVLSLPMYPELSDNEVEYIADKVCSFYRFGFYR